MRVLGVDLGTRRVGLALGDTTTTVATPLSVLMRSGDLPADRRALARIAEEWEVGCVVVGLPRSLDGTDGPAARAARDEIAELASVMPMPVEVHDERLSTVRAHHALAAAGLSSRERREKVDASAAAVILQDWLELRRSRGLEL